MTENNGYYRFYFNVTINHKQHAVTANADNPWTAGTIIRQQYPGAEHITLVSGGRTNHIPY